MSSRFAIKMAYSSLTLILCGVVIGAFWGNSTTSSAADQKLSSHGHTSERLVRTKKMLPAFNVAIDTASYKPSRSGDKFEIKAMISTLRHFRQLQYSWILPEKIKILDPSQLQGTVHDIDPKNPTLLQSYFVSESDENEVVILKVWVADGGQSSARSLQFNTIDQLEIDATYNQMRENNAEYIEQNLPSK